MFFVALTGVAPIIVQTGTPTDPAVFGLMAAIALIYLLHGTFRASGDGLIHAQVAHRTGLPKPAISRLTQAMSCATWKTEPIMRPPLHDVVARMKERRDAR